MNEGTVVSRNDIYGTSEEEEPQSVEAPSLYGNYDFEEIEIDHPTHEERQEQDGENNEADPAMEASMEFQLFGGDGISAVNLIETPKEIKQGRPLSYYIFQPSREEKQTYQITAVSGDFVLKEAEFWKSLASKNPIAPDINKDWVKPKRRCRPGKSARLNKKMRNERKEQEEKQKREMLKNRKRSFRFKHF